MLLALLGASIAGGCGIPQISFLAPPELQTSNRLPPALTFGHDPSNDVDGFLGYELYYKFYGSANTQADFAKDREALAAAGPQNATTILRQRGFYRVYASGSNTSPTIPISVSERALDFDVNIQFQFTTTGQPARAAWDATGPESVDLVRDQSILNSSEGDLGFSAAELEPGVHPDLPSDTPLGTIDMAVAILSYGIDFEIFSPIYSLPVVVEQLLGVSY